MDILYTLGELIQNLATLLYELFVLAWRYILIIVWIAWFLLGVNWRRTWAFLGQGAWAPLVLLMFLSAITWAALVPSACDCLGLIVVPNFWWQLGYVAMLVAIAFFCGYLQRVFDWAPADISFDPPAEHGHHGHHVQSHDLGDHNFSHSHGDHSHSHGDHSHSHGDHGHSHGH